MEKMEMNLFRLNIISLTGSSIYSTMLTYQKHSQSSEVFNKDQFSNIPHLDDIDNCLRHSSIIKYADDTVIMLAEMTQDRSRKN